MKKWIPFILMLIVLCGGKNLYAQDTLGRVAILIPQSGPFASFGELQHKGYELARINAAREGNKIEVRYFNADFKKGKAADFLKSHVLEWQPDILIGPYSSFHSQEVIKSLSKKKTPLILPSAIKDDLTMSFSPNIYRVALPARILAKTVADFIALKKEEWKIKQVVILTEKSEFAQSAEKALKQVLPLPSKVVLYEASRAESLFSELKNEKETLLIAIHRAPQECIQIYEALKKNLPFIGFLAGFVTPEFRQYAKENEANLYVVSPWQDDMLDPLAVQFISQFKNKFSSAFSANIPQYHSAQAYASLMIAVEALKLHHETQDPLNEILINHIFKTPLGRVSFVNFGGYYQQSITGAVIQQYANGGLKTVFPRDLLLDASKQVQSEVPFWKSLLDNQFISLFSIIALGLLLGSLRLGPVSLGSSGVLFIALLFGHFHFTIPSGTGTLGLIFFIFCVGISAGPTFFSAFVKEGAKLAKLSIIVVALATVTTILIAKYFALPRDLAVGLLAGALTSTPAFASAMDTLKDLGTNVSVGYGIAYPFGVIGVVLFVQLLPKLLKKDLDQLSEEVAAANNEKTNIVLHFVKVQNPAIIGKKIQDCHFIFESNCQISRVLENNFLKPLEFNTEFERGQVLRIVGHENKIKTVIDYIGKEAKKVQYEWTSDKDTMDIVVTSGDVIENSLKKLELLKNYGITITRIFRNEKFFTPTLETCIEENDQLRAVGKPEDLQRFAEVCGHSLKALHETDLLSLSVGITVGVLIGLIPISLMGAHSFSLGLSGGLLITSLLLGHFGRIGQIVGRIPIASRLLMMELGLVFFLAHAGIKAGSSFIPVLQEYGLKLFLLGGLITLIPLVIGYLCAHYFFKINLLQSLGGLCGGMTSTPALGAIRSKTDSDIPLVSYAAAYPVALIFMLVAAQVVLAVLKVIS